MLAVEKREKDTIFTKDKTCPNWDNDELREDVSRTGAILIAVIITNLLSNSICYSD